jgi:alkaline phosphatase D
VLGIDQLQNYGRISVTGPRGARKLTVEFKGIKGDTIKDWSVSETELKVKRK